MKFSFPITITRKGIFLKCKDYIMHFPWLCFFGYGVYKYPIDTIAYKNSSKLQGFSYNQIIAEWISSKFANNNIIVLTNISVESKNIKFWAKVPRTDMIHFIEDVVILFCTDKSEMIRLIENIPATFADAQGFHKGKLIMDNKDD